MRLVYSFFGYILKAYWWATGALPRLEMVRCVMSQTLAAVTLELSGSGLGGCEDFTLFFDLTDAFVSLSLEES